MPKLTLSMIVKNEEKYLRDCLESVKGVADEIVIVDTGSTDDTLRIASEFNAKIYKFNWINDFSAARNFALSKSTGNWILYLDADERLNKKSKKELLNVIQEEGKVAVYCSIYNIDEYRNNPKLMKYLRLFKNSESIRFSGKAHEQIEPSLVENRYAIKNSTIEITHLGYNISNEDLKLKARRNLELMLSDYKIQPTSYLSFQIANSYSILEDDRNRIKFYSEALNDPTLKKEYKAICCVHLADYEMRNKNIDKAKIIIEKALQLNKDHTLLNMIAAQVYDKLENSKLSLKYCQYAFEMNNKTQEKGNSNNLLDIIIDNKKILLEGILLSLKYGEQDSLNSFLFHMRNESQDYYNNVANIINDNIRDDYSFNSMLLFVDENNLDQILKLLKFNSNMESKLLIYSKLLDKFSSNNIFLNDFGAFLLSINQLDEAKVIFELSLESESFEESTLFYLSSIYANNGEINSLKKLIEKGEKKAKHNPFFADKLNLLKNKVAPILNSYTQ